MKIDVNGFKSITFQDFRFHWCSSFLMAQLKRSLAILPFLYIVESLLKPLLPPTKNAVAGLASNISTMEELAYHQSTVDSCTGCPGQVSGD